jgi:outer membrane lipoprotein-sorting protein
MTTDRHDNPDILESAVGALRQTGDAPGPSPEALARTRAAMRAAAQARPALRLAERITHMKYRKRLVQIAAVAAAVIIGFTVWKLLPSDGKAGVAFADVREQIEKMQTMTLTGVAEMKGAKKPITMKMFFKSPGLMRQEMTMDMSAFLPPGASLPATMPAGLKTISIMDIPGQKGLSLIPSQKKAIVIEFKNLPAATAAKAQEDNLLEKLKKAVAGEHQDLGEKAINGVKAKGYRCKDADMPSATMDIWADASTGKPLMVEWELPQGLGKMTMTDFVLDPKLDDSLFDTKVPAGYSTESQTVDLNVGEDDLIKWLRHLAQWLGGEFPKSVMPTMGEAMELTKQIQAVVKAGKAKEPSVEEAQEFSKETQKAIMFLAKMMQTGQYVYAGDGVKLGDKATPIFWYKDKDAKAYRVIYGDLHVEDAQTPPKPPATKPAE